MGKLRPLQKKSDLRLVFKRGTRSLSPHFTLYCKKNTSRVARVAIALAKRHIKLATSRNRLRRVSKEEIRNTINCSGSGCDIIVTSRKTPTNPCSKKVTDEIKNLIAKCKKECNA